MKTKQPDITSRRTGHVHKRGLIAVTLVVVTSRSQVLGLVKANKKKRNACPEHWLV